MVHSNVLDCWDFENVFGDKMALLKQDGLRNPSKPHKTLISVLQGQSELLKSFHGLFKQDEGRVYLIVTTLNP